MRHKPLNLFTDETLMNAAVHIHIKFYHHRIFWPIARKVRDIVLDYLGYWGADFTQTEFWDKVSEQCDKEDAEWAEMIDPNYRDFRDDELLNPDQLKALNEYNNN